MKRLLVLLITLSIGNVSGCGVRLIAYVDSIAIPSASDYKTYILLSGNKEILETDLHFKEFSTIVDRSLKMKGFQKADSMDTADLAVMLNYGVSDPEMVSYSGSIPIYGQVGGGYTSHSGSIYGGGGGYATYSGSSYQMPQYGVVSNIPYSGTRAIYHRHLRLEALNIREYRATEEMEELESVWMTTVLSTGTTGDLRQIIPVLVAACMDYIGTDTEKSQKVEIYMNDKRVKMLKGEADASATTSGKPDA